jgi:hypothetical protein
MLQQTFMHIPGIGRETERDMWLNGIQSWDDADRFEKRFGSRAWLETLSTVLGRSVHVQSMCWEAAGTADIAGRLIWKRRASRRWNRSNGIIRADRELIQDNLRRASELYQMKGWI